MKSTNRVAGRLGTGFLIALYCMTLSPWVVLADVLADTPVASRDRSTPYIGCFEVASLKHEVPVELLLGVAKNESNFNPDARSTAGAHGIMQIRWPLTAKYLGIRRVSELYNPCLNIDVGASYISELLGHYAGNERLALAAYNYGPTRLQNESDIPASVARYVTRVLKARDGLISGVSPPTEGLLLLNQFHRLTLANGYISALQRRFPAATFVVESSNEYVQGTERQLIHSVLLDESTITISNRLMLERML